MTTSDGNETFDFIVSGAGSAGAVVAARLSESGRYRVLLLEAGPPDTNPWIHIPLGFAKTYVDERVNWKFESAPQPQFNNRRIYVPRGKTLGGTSSINGMVYMRGHPQDYNDWRQRGCVGWDWDSVLGLYAKLLNAEIDAAITSQPPFAIPKAYEWHVLREEPFVVLAPASLKARDPHQGTGAGAIHQVGSKGVRRPPDRRLSAQGPHQAQGPVRTGWS